MSGLLYNSFLSLIFKVPSFSFGIIYYSKIYLKEANDESVSNLKIFCFIGTSLKSELNLFQDESTFIDKFIPLINLSINNSLNTGSNFFS